jgi:anti-sigma B factor antagonist
MDSSDVARTSHAATEPVSAVPAARVAPPRPSTEDDPGRREGAVEPVAVVRGVRPAASPWVLVSRVGVAHGDRVVVALMGEIDIANAGYIRAELTYLIDAGHLDLVADLSRTVSISSSGLGVLVGVHKTVRRLGGRLQLVAASDHLLKVLRITRLTQVFTIHATLDAALRR